MRTLSFSIIGILVSTAAFAGSDEDQAKEKVKGQIDYFETQTKERYGKAIPVTFNWATFGDSFCAIEKNFCRNNTRLSGYLNDLTWAVVNVSSLPNKATDPAVVKNVPTKIQKATVEGVTTTQEFDVVLQGTELKLLVPIGPKGNRSAFQSLRDGFKKKSPQC